MKQHNEMEQDGWSMELSSCDCWKMSGENPHFLNFGTVFLTAVKLWKIRKAHCSPPLVGEDNAMVLTSHSVPFPATPDLRSLVAGNGTS